MYFLIRLFIKITNIIPALFFLMAKRHYTGKKIRTANYKGPLIIVQNHRGFMDYLVIVMMFFFRKVNVVVSELLYDHSKPLRFLLKAMGAIRADRFSGNPDFINKSISVLKKGGILLIYPESKIETTDELLEFKRSVGVISIQSGAPVLPIYHDGNIGLFKRDRCIFGDIMYPDDYIDEQQTLSDNSSAFTNEIYNKVVYLKSIYDRTFFKRKKDKKKPEHVTFGYRFMRSTATPPLKLFCRPVIEPISPITEIALHSQKRLLVICNHCWWLDAPLLYHLLKRQNPRCLAAKDVAEKNRASFFAQKTLGCIFLDRNGFDWNSTKACIKELEDEGCLIIFPEGQLNLGSQLVPFHTGAAMMALMTNSPILPVYITGCYKFFSKTRITVGEPILLDECISGKGVNNTRIAEANELLYSTVNDLKDRAQRSLSEKEKAKIAAWKQETKKKLGHDD